MVTPLVLLSELGQEIEQGSDITSVARHRQLITEASDRLQKWCNRRFDESIATRYYNAHAAEKGGDVWGYELWLDTDLRSVTTLTNGDSNTIGSTYFNLLPANESAKQIIRLTATSPTLWTYQTDPINAISVLGKWGYGGEWISTGTTLAVAITDAAALTFTSSGGSSLEVGMMLKIDNEYLSITSISTNTITVTRGANGSTAATHLISTVVYRWQAEPVVQDAIKMLVLWHIQRVQARLANEVFVGSTGLPVSLPSAPKEVQDLVYYAKLTRKGRIRAV